MIAVAVAALLLVAVTVGVTWQVAQRGEERREAANIALVLDMWDGVINRADRAAVMKYIAPDYRQHNPNVAQGRQGVLELIDVIRDPPPDMVPPGRKTFRHALAQGEYVAIIWDQPQPDPRDPGKTYVGQAFDMFRVQGGQVVEHWDDTRKASRPWTREND